MPPKTKGESSNLIRVRNNQRRSRARRREYVAELERKVHECNAQGLPSCTPDVVPQDTIVRLEEENRKLRELLLLAGVEQALVDTHLAPEGGVPEVADGDNCLQSSPETAQENLNRFYNSPRTSSTCYSSLFNRRPLSTPLLYFKASPRLLCPFHTIRPCPHQVSILFALLNPFSRPPVSPIAEQHCVLWHMSWCVIIIREGST
ncbi:hypothetical protein DL98DRAFT_189831 [Cadophora sp. DSE1049]|nr:hypothetical protein DL98DRAFT_189831 [Cadophora sp. DSE1049]